jgi:hypothetical protein
VFESLHVHLASEGGYSTIHKVVHRVWIARRCYMSIAGLQTECPQCGKQGTVRGIKHHYTTVHANGEPGHLAVAVVEVERHGRRSPRRTRPLAAA